jgi:hypothetical protein
MNMTSVQSVKTTKTTKAKITAEDVLAFMKKRKGPVTTVEVADNFSMKVTRAAAFLAILRIKDAIEPASPPKTADGVSRWRVK